MPGGCPRCLVRKSQVCCSLCTPDYHLFGILPSLTAPKECLVQASRVPVKYIMSSLDHKLHVALHVFRREKTLLLYGRRQLNNRGPSIILGDDQLKRVIHCARAHKLDSVEALVREMKWSRARELGEEILKLVHEYVLPPSYVVSPPSLIRCNIPFLCPFSDIIPTLPSAPRCLPQIRPTTSSQAVGSLLPNGNVEHASSMVISVSDDSLL